jgi:hypothetical protein
MSRNIGELAPSLSIPMELAEMERNAGTSNVSQLRGRFDRFAQRASQVAIAVALASFMTLAGCQGRYTTFESNPDRDLTGLSIAPLLPVELRLLQRVAEVRESWVVARPADVVVSDITTRATACFAGRTQSSTLAPIGGAFMSVSGARERAVVVERWPEHDATVVGLQQARITGFGEAERGFIVMFAVQPIGPAQSQVYAYRREDSGEQRNLVQMGRSWGQGSPECP